MLHRIVALLIAAAVNCPANAQENLPSMTPAQSAKPDDKKPAPLYDEKADVKALIADAMARAKKENRRVLIQWGGNWCGWCTRLHNLYRSDDEIGRQLRYEYDVVYADAGKPEGKNIDLATTYGADLMKHGFPYLTILDADGKVLANQDTGSLELKGAAAAPWHDRQLVLELFTKHQATPLDAAMVLDEAIAQASQSGKRVFLHFGAPWCGWCRRLDAWIDRPEIKSILSKEFVDVKIDIDRMTGGKDVLAKFNPESKGGIPWFVFLDSTGQPLATSVGPKGNIGFPAQPEEIAHFQAMLANVAVNLAPEEIKTLVDSLKTK